jgi:hypothetical protein
MKTRVKKVLHFGGEFFLPLAVGFALSVGIVRPTMNVACTDGRPTLSRETVKA